MRTSTPSFFSLFGTDLLFPMADGALAPSDDTSPVEEAASSPNQWVAVSNEMIMARLDWDIMMHRILMVLISQIDSKNDEAFRM